MTRGNRPVHVPNRHACGIPWKQRIDVWHHPILWDRSRHGRLIDFRTRRAAEHMLRMWVTGQARLSKRALQAALARRPHVEREIETITCEQALAEATKGRRAAVAARCMAVLNSYKIATTEQCAAIIGCSYPATKRALELLWLAGWLDYGTPMTALNFGGEVVPTMWTINNDGALDFARFRRLWGDDEAIRATAGWNIAPHISGPRHHLFTTELALRIAEVATDVRTVVGERFSSWQQMVDPTARRTTDAADLTVVRGDGLKIMVEVSLANSGGQPKLVKWIERLTKHLDDDGGEFAVVFVDVANPRVGDQRTRIEPHMAAAINQVGLSAQMTRRVLDRIGFVDWQEWFPAEHQLGPDFATLTCKTMLDPSGTLYRRTRFLGGHALSEPADDFRVEEPVDDFQVEERSTLFKTMERPVDPGAAGGFVKYKPFPMATRMVSGEAVQVGVDNRWIDRTATMTATPHWLAARMKPVPVWHWYSAHRDRAAAAPTQMKRAA